MPGKLQTGHKLYLFMVTCANRHSPKVQKYDQDSLGVWVRNYVSRSFLMKKKLVCLQSESTTIYFSHSIGVVCNSG